MIFACLVPFKYHCFYLNILMRFAKGRAKAWLIEVTSRERRRSRRPQQKLRKPARSKAAPCCIYPPPKDACEVTKAAAAAIAGQMSQRQASREHAVCRSHVQRAVDRHRYITARSTDLSLPCSSSGFYTCNRVCHLHLLSPLCDLCLCRVEETLQPKAQAFGGPERAVRKSHCHVFLGGLDPGQAPLKTLLLMLRLT